MIGAAFDKDDDQGAVGRVETKEVNFHIDTVVGTNIVGKDTYALKIATTLF